MYLQGLGQDVRLLLGLVVEVVADPPQLHAFGPDGVDGVVVALDQLVAVQRVELGLLQGRLGEEKVTTASAIETQFTDLRSSLSIF